MQLVKRPRYSFTTSKQICMPLQAELTQKWLGLDAALKTQIEGLLLSALATQVNPQVFKKKASAPLLVLFKDS